MSRKQPNPPPTTQIKPPPPPAPPRVSRPSVSTGYPRECTEVMLQAAVNKAVDLGMFPEADFCYRVAERWGYMRQCINAALNEAANK